MQKLIIALSLTLAPIFAHAALTPAQEIEAKAVLNSSEIKDLLAVEMKHRHLKCDQATLSDVIIKADADMDSFTMTYACNDPKFGANYQRLDFVGGVYTASPTSQTAEVVFTGLQVEMSE